MDGNKHSEGLYTTPPSRQIEDSTESMTIPLGVAVANRDASTALSVTLLLGLVVRMTKTAHHIPIKT